MTVDSTADKPDRQPLTLLDTMIVILISCSILIFVFTIGAKFLGRDTFDKLPDFLKDSYSALWSAGVVAGGALVGAVVDTLSKRPSTKTSFIAYVMLVTFLIMALIVGTVELSKAIEGPQFSVPTGATEVKLTADTDGPVNFYLQNRLLGGNQARIGGSYEIKGGQLTGEITEAELLPVMGPAPPMALDSISIHVCYLAVRNGYPMATQRPEFPLASNRQAIATMMNLQQPYPIPAFTFKIDISRVDNIAPAYLCAYVGGPATPPMSFY